jgi:hypothetical protein
MIKLERYNKAEHSSFYKVSFSVPWKLKENLYYNGKISAINVRRVQVVVGMTVPIINRRNHIHITKKCLLYQTAFPFFKGRLYLFLV